LRRTTAFAASLVALIMIVLLLACCGSRCSGLLDEVVDHQRATKLGRSSLGELAQINRCKLQPLYQSRDVGTGCGIIT